jgi:arabinan endo-1,5-alpha-L-arabinosidase
MVYQNENGQWFFLQEITPYQSSKNELLNNQESRVLDLRELFWTSDGWPVLSPVTYHKVDKDEISPKDLMGNYEFIKLTPMLPQGVFNSVTLSILDHSMQGVSSTRNSWAWKIPQTAQGRLELGGSIRGYWRLLDMDVIEFNYENYIETYQISMAWDPDLDQRLIILTGKDSNGLACFAKKVYQS